MSDFIESTRQDAVSPNPSPRSLRPKASVDPDERIEQTVTGKPNSVEQPNARLLNKLAAKAFEELPKPPADFKLLVASAARYMLTSLEPAMQIARDIREQASLAPPSDSVGVFGSHRRDHVLEVLLD